MGGIDAHRTKRPCYFNYMLKRRFAQNWLIRQGAQRGPGSDQRAIGIFNAAFHHLQRRQHLRLLAPIQLGKVSALVEMNRIHFPANIKNRHK